MRRTVNGSSCIDVVEACFFVSPNRLAVFGIRIDHDAPCTVREEFGRELTDDRSTVTLAYQFGNTDRDIDAQRAFRLVLIGMTVLRMRIIALKVTYRMPVQLTIIGLVSILFIASSIDASSVSGARHHFATCGSANHFATRPKSSRLMSRKRYFGACSAFGIQGFHHHIMVRVDTDIGGNIQRATRHVFG